MYDGRVLLAERFTALPAPAHQCWSRVGFLGKLEGVDDMDLGAFFSGTLVNTAIVVILLYLLNGWF